MKEKDQEVAMKAEQQPQPEPAAAAAPAGPWFASAGEFHIMDVDGTFNGEIKSMSVDENLRYTGKKGELVFTKENKQFHLHDGKTPSGSWRWELVRG